MLIEHSQLDHGALQVQGNYGMTQEEYLKKVLEGCEQFVKNVTPSKTAQEQAKDNVFFLGRAWELARSAGLDNLRDEYRLDLEMAMEEERELDWDSQVNKE
jgi:hypothetical protein